MRNMGERFIVFIDFSDYSKRLLSFAGNWAERVGAELLLIHFTQDLIPGLGESEALDAIKRDSEERAREKLRAFAGEVLGAHPVADFLISAGNPSSFIEDLHKPGKADFLFAGMKNKNLLERILNVSTTINLANDIDKTIIAVPDNVETFSFEKLYVGIVRKYPLNNAEFGNLLSITGGRVKELHFFSVLRPGVNSDKAEAYLQDICSLYAGRLPVSCEIRYGKDAYEEIKTYMEQNKGVLVVQKGTRSIADIFRKFFISKMIYHARVPLIILS